MVKDIEKTEFILNSPDGTKIQVYKWEPLNKTSKGVVQISHGMAETVSRYEEFAKILVKRGYTVYGNDHRGHGLSSVDIDTLGFLGEESGFVKLIEDISALTDYIKKENPNLPIILFGHSMGSFASQRFIMDNKDKINGLILSGSNGEQGPALKFGKFIANLERKIRGSKAKSNLLNKISFGSYNKKFSPNRTEFDWLSRDEKEVDKYIENPYCGTVFPASFYYEFFDTLQYIEDEENFNKIPKDLPILIISGDKDPVGNFGVGVKNLFERYESIGVEDLEIKLYEGARHELLKEINRDEVIEDIINWIDNLIFLDFRV